MLATLGLEEYCKNSYFHTFIPHAIQLDTSAFLVNLQTLKMYQVQPKECVSARCRVVQNFCFFSEVIHIAPTSLNK